MICGLFTDNLTDCDMKRLTNTLTAVVLWTMAVFGFSSCIFDGAGDRFYRTLWECTQEPLDTLEIGQLRLEFLCGNAVSLKTDTFPNIVYGTYKTDGETALFQGLEMKISGISITFTDASRSGDTLYLKWLIEGTEDQYTTTMHRLSSYN